MHELGVQYPVAVQGIYHENWDAVQGVVESHTQSDNLRDGNGFSVSISEGRIWIGLENKPLPVEGKCISTDDGIPRSVFQDQGRRGYALNGLLY